KWYGFSYRWRRNQQDADLAPIDGLNDSIRTFPDGLAKPLWKKKWFYPSQRDCNRCHGNGHDSYQNLHTRGVLGFFTAQLNRTYWHGTGNQMDSLFARNVIKLAANGQKPANWNNSPRWWAPADPASGDPRDSLGARARAYIAANCSGCHSPRGI